VDLAKANMPNSDIPITFRDKLARSVRASLVRIVGYASIESRAAYAISDDNNNNRTPLHRVYEYKCEVEVRRLGQLCMRLVYIKHV
jgi:hypothetical protein